MPWRGCWRGRRGWRRSASPVRRSTRSPPGGVKPTGLLNWGLAVGRLLLSRSTHTARLEGANETGSRQLRRGQRGDGEVRRRRRGAAGEPHLLELLKEPLADARAARACAIAQQVARKYERPQADAGRIVTRLTMSRSWPGIKGTATGSLFAMRRANGDWFAPDDRGRFRGPLFSSQWDGMLARVNHWGMQLFKQIG